MSKSIVWFRNDLRLNDHLPLTKAIEQSKEIIPVFVLDTSFEETHPLAFPRAGAFRLKFLLESLQDLKQSLKEIGSDLVVLRGNTVAVLSELVRKEEVSAIYASKEIATEETLVEEELAEQLAQQNVKLELLSQSTLFERESLVWPIADLPDIFTSFRKEMEKKGDIHSALPAPKQLTSPKLSETVIPTLADLGFSNDVTQDRRTAITARGGTKAARERLDQYLWEGDHLRNYKETRNGMIGSDYSSKFSLWLANGCISPREIYEGVKRYEKERKKNQSTYWMVFELIWRDYFRFVALKYGSKIFQKEGIKVGVDLDWKKDADLFEKWRLGQTGVPFIDANMRELSLTGFMSNRGRQNVASFLVKDLGLDWRWGAAWFESQLIDYDVYSNWGNWMYVAGVGNDPRETRYFNILTQASRYDPKGDYVRLWVKELAKIPDDRIHFPSQLRPHELADYGVVLSKDYPEAILDMSKWLSS